MSEANIREKQTDFEKSGGSFECLRRGVSLCPMHELAAVLPYKLIQIVITFKDKRILVLPHLPIFYRKEDRSGGRRRPGG